MKLAHNVVLKMFQDDIQTIEEVDLSLFENILPEYIKEYIKNLNEKELKEALKKENIFIEIENLKLKDSLKRTSDVSIIGGKDLFVVEFKIEKDKIIKDILKNLKEKLGKKQCDLIVSQENRVDEDCNFFIRLDKNELIKNNFILTDGGNCLHIKFKLACYPNKREVGLKLVEEIFSN
ncbi:MAG: RNA-binding domain-containing protein [Candidatus Woesearchaeota archaeon]